LADTFAGPSWDTVPNKDEALETCRAWGKPLAGGAHACRCLSLLVAGKALREKPSPPTGLGKTDRPG